MSPKVCTCKNPKCGRKYRPGLASYSATHCSTKCKKAHTSALTAAMYRKIDDWLVWLKLTPPKST